MAAPLSAVDSIAPAFSRTKRLLFQPFRIGVWARLSIVALTTGEFATGGWGGTVNLKTPGPEVGRKILGLIGEPRWPPWRENLPWIVLAAVLVILLGALALYCSCVCRFILFDSVLHERYELRGGWRRWRYQGRKLFWWDVGFGSATLGVLALIAGLPALLAWRAGWFREPGAHVAGLVLGGVALVLIAGAIFLAAAVVDLFAKDFLVAVMAQEGWGVFAGWRRLLPVLELEKLPFTGYVFMKIVLAVGSAILFGIANFVAVLLMLIPLGVLGVATYGVWKGAGITWSLPTLSALVLLAAAAISLILFVIGFIYAPGLVFFQSYTLHFLGSRYPALGVVLFPASEVVPPPLEPPPAAAPFPAG